MRRGLVYLLGGDNNRARADLYRLEEPSEHDVFERNDHNKLQLLPRESG
ncbi:MAG: hypothetical protein IPJ33_18020 [Gammaproteobacteria bacterium]|nr:hypothetical protein [Gammaproteobacteria bacterium]MBP6051438.1 hypothetical protein [Pseudomonadales bacterium]MBK6287804.1 hypothetical protein [Gammaproteobacteria bacterium]MBK6582790.1 hypothetical protein [Gammaproteobacteria bacterium]MBK7171281.1 hypothetical protein [Gammaproteobacteria bacterium]